jgi:23S rRNA (uracil1939-C5)-methyltransferase
MKQVLNDSLIQKEGKPDVIITDPPRAGMHEDVVKKIMELLPARIVYVSCNPATQARDIALMTELYKVTRVQPVDMFPHTHHVECVTLLERK